MTDNKQEEQKKAPKMRQIIIETDGNKVNIVKAEVAGNLELIAILNSIIGYLNK